MTTAEWASRIWPVLTLAASGSQVLTYDKLAKIIGQVRPALGKCLEPIQSYCLVKGLPALTSIVVSEKTGLPGIGFTAAADVPRTQMAVFDHDWMKTKVPTATDLKLAVKQQPSNG
jgi:hypothetical protein